MRRRGSIGIYENLRDTPASAVSSHLNVFGTNSLAVANVSAIYGPETFSTATMSVTVPLPAFKNPLIPNASVGYTTDGQIAVQIGYQFPPGPCLGVDVDP